MVTLFELSRRRAHEVCARTLTTSRALAVPTPSTKMIKCALALATVLVLANGQAPTVDAPGNQCETEGAACQADAGCTAATADWSFERGTGLDVAACAANTACAAFSTCRDELMLFHRAKSDIQSGCQGTGFTDPEAQADEYGNTNYWVWTTRTEEACTSPVCQWCGADAGCDGMISTGTVDENGDWVTAVQPTCTYNPAMVFDMLSNAATAGASIAATECMLKDSEAACLERPQVDQVCTRDDPECVDPDWANCGSNCGPPCAQTCVPGTPTDPAPCQWASGTCAATAARLEEATIAFEAAINALSAPTEEPPTENPPIDCSSVDTATQCVVMALVDAIGRVQSLAGINPNLYCPCKWVLDRMRAASPDYDPIVVSSCNHNNPVDCVGAMGDWGDCSVSCGGGVQTRSFIVATPAANGGSCVADGTSEAQDCNTHACPGDTGR